MKIKYIGKLLPDGNLSVTPEVLEHIKKGQKVEVSLNCLENEEISTRPGQISSKDLTKRFIPYGHQSIDENDVTAVCEVLRSDWLTCGPKVAEFEEELCRFVGVKHGVALSSGTAALHAAMYAIGIGPGDEVIVPPLTFAATANAVVFQGAIPVFSDVDPDTLLLDPGKAENRITLRTKAIICVDYAGQPCDYNALRNVASRHKLALVADSCHALGAEYKGQRLGGMADLTVFSFHPVKHITTGEGGMVTTNNGQYAQRMQFFRNHGITTDHRQRAERGSWLYEMIDIGYNYRLSDMQCALGISQMRKVEKWIKRRQWIAGRYDAAFKNIGSIKSLMVRSDVYHAYHLYVILLNLEHLKADRTRIFGELRDRGIGVNVHYIPVHLHPFYRQKFRTMPGLCPVAEVAYERMITLPLFPSMTDDDVEMVTESVREAIAKYQK